MSIALLPRLEWEAARAAHRVQVEPEIDPARLENPVESFMWTYYSYRPRELRRYHPGALVTLEDGPEYLERRGYGARDEGVGVSEAFMAQRRSTLEFVLAYSRQQHHGRQILVALACMSGPWSIN